MTWCEDALLLEYRRLFECCFLARELYLKYQLNWIHYYPGVATLRSRKLVWWSRVKDSFDVNKFITREGSYLQAFY